MCAANVFGVVPKNVARDVSILLMVIHEVRNVLEIKVLLQPPALCLSFGAACCSLAVMTGMPVQCVAYAIYLTPVLFMVRITIIIRLCPLPTCAVLSTRPVYPLLLD